MKSLAVILVLAVVVLNNGYGVMSLSYGAELDAAATQRIEDELIIRLDDIEKGLPPQQEGEKLFDQQSCKEIDDSTIPQDILLKMRLLENQEVECVYKGLFAQALQRQKYYQEKAGEDAVTALQPSPLLWNGNSCGCVPAAKQIVYGFYPVEEMASAEEQLFDFSVLSRIGYKSLTFDENGKIEERVHWKKEKPYSNFINEAHRYRSKIDLVISNNEWEKWGEFSPEETSVVFDKLSGNIVKLVNKKLSNDWLNVLKPYISFGYSRTRTIGDGVTMYLNFEGIQEDPKKTFANLYSFINQLRDRLDQTGEPFFLNMIIPLQDVLQNRGVYHLNNLQKLVDDVDLFLVEVKGPIEDQMKQLRTEIEEQFPSSEQETMVRKMVPVLSPGMNINRLHEGLIYVEDNFGGVGLSTIPIVGEGQAPLVNQALKEFLHFEDGAICQFVCSYRWPLRGIIFFIGVFGIGYALLAIGIYDLRNFYTHHSGYFTGGALLTMIPLVFTFSCDPFWKDHQSELLFLALIMSAGILILKLQKRKEGTYP